MELRNKEVKYVYLELIQWATHIFILIVFPIVAMVATFATYATGMAGAVARVARLDQLALLASAQDLSLACFNKSTPMLLVTEST